MSTNENQHSNFDVRKYLPKALIIFIYLASLVIFKEEWITIINVIWVDPIAGKFNTNELLWLVIWGLSIGLILTYYAIQGIVFVLSDVNKWGLPKPCSKKPHRYWR